MNVSKVVSRSKSALYQLQIEVVGLQMFIDLNFLWNLAHYLSNLKGLNNDVPWNWISNWNKYLEKGYEYIGIWWFHVWSADEGPSDLATCSLGVGSTY